MQRNYYDGHHRQHDVGFLTFCDCFGVTRLVHGPVRGAANDINSWYTSDFKQNINRYFGNHGKVLFDGIYAYVNGPFICSFPNPSNLREYLFNALHSQARSIIENTYSRQKLWWPI